MVRVGSYLATRWRSWGVVGREAVRWKIGKLKSIVYCVVMIFGSGVSNGTVGPFCASETSSVGCEQSEHFQQVLPANGEISECAQTTPRASKQDQLRFKSALT